MTNFDFLKNDQEFEPFANAAIAAERIINIDVAASAVNCRRAMEMAVKWMYSIDSSLAMPYDEKLVTLVNTKEFKEIVDKDTRKRMDFIRRIGNYAAHTTRNIKWDEAALCLENLYDFLDLVAYYYAETYTERIFNPTFLQENYNEPIPVLQKEELDVDLQALIAENKILKEELTARRDSHQDKYTPKPLDLSEYKTRKLYIDAMLVDAGWVEGKNWINEYELFGMPNHSGDGRADYVLFGDDGKPLAVIEAKKTCKNPKDGTQQAKLYADILEKNFKGRPIIFLTNGFDTYIWNDRYENERKISTIYSKRDLEKLFNLQTMKTSLKYVHINRGIAGRYYQEAAIKAVCDAFDQQNHRRALVVMATGSGKTRMAIALVDILLQHGWIKNVLFLADRNALIAQAKRNFINFMPDLSVTNLSEEKKNYGAHCIFSTYQTMMNCIDTVEDEEGKLFTCGHFDLIICDEAHRSIYNKYREIFDYFDGLLLGLTATPKDEIDKNTYGVFELENGVPTYGYDLAQAVKDGYLVDFVSVETKLKFLEQGIVYDELSEEEKEEYENTFANESGNLPEKISSSALNDWVFNDDTIKKVIDILMNHGIRVGYGEKPGKTIIFAKNHAHAMKIHDIFQKEYPKLVGYTKVIDNQTTYAQNAIDDFSDPNKFPQIAISVDMLDTGIDIPEILNLVFFKKVLSKAKFWQMIGRGTRLCPELLDGKDKDKFYIFDFCNNFEFFRGRKSVEVPAARSVQGEIFFRKAQLAFRLQSIEYQTPELVEFRKSLVDDMVGRVRDLNRENFAVHQHLKYVDKYSLPENYMALVYGDTLIMDEELAPLVLPDEDEVNAIRFDALMYGIELALLEGKTHTRGRGDLIKRVGKIAGIANIPEIMAQSELIDKILHTNYFEEAGIHELEHIRDSLRNLMKYIPPGREPYFTNFEDDLLVMDFKNSDLENDDLRNYKAKAEYYIRQHQDNAVITKLKTNIPLKSADIVTLEHILWNEVGSKEDYEAEMGMKPLGEFVREVVGLDMNAAKAAFAEYLDSAGLNSRQIYFVNQVIEYVVRNGMMKDFSVMQETPFTDRGSIVTIFPDISVWGGIRAIINEINENARAA